MWYKIKIEGCVEARNEDEAVEKITNGEYRLIDAGAVPVQSVNDVASPTMMTDEERVNYTFNELGLDPGLSGYNYIKTAVEMARRDYTVVQHMTHVMYPEIAKKYGTTASRVERAIRHAVEKAFDSMPPAVATRYFGSVLSYDRGKVCNTTFIAAVAVHLGHVDRRDK